MTYYVSSGMLNSKDSVTQWYNIQHNHDIDGHCQSASHYNALSYLSPVSLLLLSEFIQRDEFSEHLVRELELLQQQEANELRQRELERNTCKVLLPLSVTVVSF